MNTHPMACGQYTPYNTFYQALLLIKGMGGGKGFNTFIIIQYQEARKNVLLAKYRSKYLKTN